MNEKQEIGKLGEKLAKKFLEEREYQIICQNFRTKLGEIDIIARNQEETIVFVEVKTRTSLRFGNPSEAVKETKIDHIIKTAKYFLYSNNMVNQNTRFDVIEIFICKGRYTVNHIKQII